MSKHTTCLIRCIGMHYSITQLWRYHVLPLLPQRQHVTTKWVQKSDDYRCAKTVHYCETADCVFCKLVNISLASKEPYQKQFVCVCVHVCVCDECEICVSVYVLPASSGLEQTSIFDWWPCKISNQ